MDGEKRTGDQAAAENLFITDLRWKFEAYDENAAGSGCSTNFTRRPSTSLVCGVIISILHAALFCSDALPEQGSA